MKRRDFFKSAGVIAAGAMLSPRLFASESQASDIFNPEIQQEGDLNDVFPSRSLRADVNKPVTVAILGLGNRGNVYARYSKKFPHAMKIVAIADINEARLKSLGDEYDVPKEMRFKSVDEFFAVPKMCDAVIIATPDNLHYEPAMKALQAGYHMLLEKPMCQTEKECRDVLEMTRKTGRIVALCHVLRYAPYFVALRSAIKSGMIGELVSVQHLEPIQYAHMAHSFVRGNWRNSKETTPIILAKSCHDLDILRYLIDKSCDTIVADGSIYLFRPQMALEGTPKRCTDGCPHEKDCPYSAIDIYYRKHHYLKHVVDVWREATDPEIMEALKNGPYGRCVYHCDNDQPDHYVANMVFEDGITASFSMEAFTPYGGRRTRVMGTRGFIDGDGKQFTVTEFGTLKTYVWNRKIEEIPEYKDSGHGGGDHALVRDFLEAVAWNDIKRLTSTVDASVESHVMAFDAEKSRKTGKKVKVKL
jgi:predicted dehydrogenase